MEEWPIADLVRYVEQCLEELPPPRNGQVRAVPDERTIRYYGALGLLDKPSAMRGRTAMYGRRHVAQILAIKRLQAEGKTLAEIQALWPGLEDRTLSRLTGVELPPRLKARKEFWKDTPAPAPGSTAAARSAPAPRAAPSSDAAVELRIELAPDVALVLAVPERGIAITKADIAAIRAAATPLVTELAGRRLTMNARTEKP